jgi:hypothetical protein
MRSVGPEEGVTSKIQNLEDAASNIRRRIRTRQRKPSSCSPDILTSLVDTVKKQGIHMLYRSDYDTNIDATSFLL